MSLYEYSDAQIAGIFIGGGFTVAFVFCMGLCSILYGVKHSKRRRASKSSVIKEQSESVVRGDHPIAFVLPTVSLSETGSEFSDLDSLTTGYSSSTSLSLSSGSYQQRLENLVRSSPNPSSGARPKFHRISTQPKYSTLKNEEEERDGGPPKRPSTLWPPSSSTKPRRHHRHSRSRAPIRTNYFEMSETSVGRGRSPAEIHSPGWGPRSLDSMDQHGESPEAKDYMDLTLCYEVEEEKLTLGINRVDLRPFTRESIKDQDGLYVKVTLFESLKVVKAKKTKIARLNPGQMSVDFGESFSILFPQSHMDQVSCIISLSLKSIHGSKIVIGRTSIGPLKKASTQGVAHWTEMKERIGLPITKRHYLT